MNPVHSQVVSSPRHKPFKEVFAPHLGRTVKIGGRRLRPSRGPRIHLASYLDVAKMTEVPDCDYTKNVTGLGDVLLNDRLGDCTCAGVGHIVDLVTSNAGNAFRVTDDLVKRLYELACNYVDGDPSTDQGGDELTVLDFVCEKGIDGNGLHKFDATVVVDATNKLEVRSAQYWFGNLYFGEGLPDGYVNSMPQAPGFEWDVVGDADPDNGHCFIGGGSNAKGILIDTWGLIGVQTYRAIAKYASRAQGGELHTALTCDWFSRVTKLAPNGLAYNDLMSDLKKFGRIAA